MTAFYRMKSKRKAVTEKRERLHDEPLSETLTMKSWNDVNRKLFANRKMMIILILFDSSRPPPLVGCDSVNFLENVSAFRAFQRKSFSHSAFNHLIIFFFIISAHPRWSLEPLNTIAITSRDALINCQAEGFPDPVIEWKKSNTRSLSGSYRPIIYDGRLHKLENGSLEIKHVDKLDEGFYMCKATNGIGSGISTVVQLSVRTPAHFKEEFRVETVQKSHPLVVRCEAFGDKPLAITWKKDGQPFAASTDKRYLISETISESGLTSQIKVDSADRRDSSLYTCITSNSYGSDEINLQVIVQGKFPLLRPLTWKSAIHSVWISLRGLREENSPESASVTQISPFSRVFYLSDCRRESEEKTGYWLIIDRNGPKPPDQRRTLVFIAPSRLLIPVHTFVLHSPFIWFWGDPSFIFSPLLTRFHPHLILSFSHCCICSPDHSSLLRSNNRRMDKRTEWWSSRWPSSSSSSWSWQRGQMRPAKLPSLESRVEPSPWAGHRPILATVPSSTTSLNIKRSSTNGQPMSRLKGFPERIRGPLSQVFGPELLITSGSTPRTRSADQKPVRSSMPSQNSRVIWSSSSARLLYSQDDYMMLYSVTHSCNLCLPEMPLLILPPRHQLLPPS